MKRIQAYIDNLEILQPLPTSTRARYSADGDLKAILFDIYGTLLVSASGDVEESALSVTFLEKALTESGIQILAHTNDEKTNILSKMLSLYKQTIQDFQFNIRENKNYPYPEIDIIHVCSTVLDQANKNNWISGLNGNGCKETIFLFELLSNKISPMPGMKELIQTYHKAGFPLGIVSNAQFYTPVILNYMLNGEFVETEHIEPFSKDLTIFSYKYLRGKPDVFLYEQLIPVFKNKYNLAPAEVLFVGNDMLKDIFAAQKVGFKTALFAGDKRSLRLRETDEKVKSVSPDFIITKLSQLFSIISPEKK